MIYAPSPVRTTGEGAFFVLPRKILRNNAGRKINTQNEQIFESGFDKKVWEGFRGFPIYNYG